MVLDPNPLREFVGAAWERDILPQLREYVMIPAKSPAFDPTWEKQGFLAQAVSLARTWCEGQLAALPDLQVEVVHLEGRTPVLFLELGPSAGGSKGSPPKGTVLLYGHLDKQPEMTGWREGLGPWTPVREGDRFYGRGAADDGYAVFAALTALMALRAQGVPHARCVFLIETGEESGSPDLPAYLEHLGERIGVPSLVVCLDSGCGDYDRVWTTTSLRGLVMGDLSVQILKEGVHSGSATGIVPSIFDLVEQLLARLRNPSTGEILTRHGAFFCRTPHARELEAQAVARLLGERVWSHLPFKEGATALKGNPAELLLANTWLPGLMLVGIDGVPSLANAGNVALPSITCRLSLRLPPRVNADAAAAEMKRLLTDIPPYRASVSFEIQKAVSGWDAPATQPWLERAVDSASRVHFGRPAMSMGEGGTIPFMAMLGEKFPRAQFLITGVLGPESNAHGPNEFLHIPTAKRLTCAVAHVVAELAA
jgi:acetylornithine deacetylase/succinyl-diaminopimelate desuccinylase-like protein